MVGSASGTLMVVVPGSSAARVFCDPKVWISTGVTVDVSAFNCREKVCETLPVVAFRVTVCAVVTAETVAENMTLVAVAGTVTEGGTVTAVLLLDRATLTPPLPAAALSVTVQESVPAPVIDEFTQDSALTTGVDSV